MTHSKDKSFASIDLFRSSVDGADVSDHIGDDCVFGAA